MLYQMKTLSGATLVVSMDSSISHQDIVAVLFHFAKKLIYPTMDANNAGLWNKWHIWQSNLFKTTMHLSICLFLWYNICSSCPSHTYSLIISEPPWFFSLICCYLRDRKWNLSHWMLSCSTPKMSFMPKALNLILQKHFHKILIEQWCKRNWVYVWVEQESSRARLGNMLKTPFLLLCFL